MHSQGILTFSFSKKNRMILKEKKKGKKNKITSDKVSCSILYKQLTFDQDIISPDNISAISSSQVMRIKKNAKKTKKTFLFDPIPNSPN